MTSQGKPSWGRAVTGAIAGSAIAVGLMLGVGASIAQAEPATDPTGETDAPPAMTADQALAIVAADYDMGAGGGQLSTLIHKVMTLRSQGYYPSKGNRDAIEAALAKRPNQTPLVAALEATLAYQSRTKMRAQAQPLNPATIGINQNPAQPGNGEGINIGGGGGAEQQPVFP